MRLVSRAFQCIETSLNFDCVVTYSIRNGNSKLDEVTANTRCGLQHNCTNQIDIRTLVRSTHRPNSRERRHDSDSDSGLASKQQRPYNNKKNTNKQNRRTALSKAIDGAATTASNKSKTIFQIDSPSSQREIINNSGASQCGPGGIQRKCLKYSTAEEKNRRQIQERDWPVLAT